MSQWGVFFLVVIWIRGWFGSGGMFKSMSISFHGMPPTRAGCPTRSLALKACRDGTAQFPRAFPAAHPRAERAERGGGRDCISRQRRARAGRREAERGGERGGKPREAGRPWRAADGPGLCGDCCSMSAGSSTTAELTAVSPSPARPRPCAGESGGPGAQRGFGAANHGHRLKGVRLQPPRC